MEQKKYKRTTVTAALPYANGGVHIGHLAGVYVPADIYVRYLRLKKQDVVFIGGSDEHGVPITIRAKKEGVTPQDIVDRYHSMIKKSFEDFGISFDVYSRTTSATHNKLASDFFKKLYDEGKLVEKTSMQYYDEEAKTVPRRQIYRGRMSSLPPRRRLRRPVRELRKRTRPLRN
jgi:methionyl-tRNA synthetase